MSLILCENAAHQEAVTASVGQMQADIGSATLDHNAGLIANDVFAARVRAASIAHHRRCLASAEACGLQGAEVHRTALWELGA
jgi:hypothetical protein